jgi:hypothetical protein
MLAFATAFMGFCCCGAPQTAHAADGVSDVYLWYYDVDPADLDTALDGKTAVRIKARAGLDPRDPNDDEHVQIEHIQDNDPTCPDKFVFTWEAKKGIFYRFYSSPVLVGPDADWQPEGDDWIQAEENGIMVYESCPPPEPSRFWRLASRNGSLIDLNGLTPYDHALIETASADLDRNDNGFPDRWEWLNFGMLGVDPTADADNDGLSNLAEYLAGTDPQTASATVPPASLNLIVYSP